KGNLSFESRFTQIEPFFRRLSGADQIRIVGNPVLAPVPRRPTVLLIYESAVLFQNLVGRRGWIPSDQILLQNYREIRHRQAEDICQMATCPLFRDKALRCVLRT